MPRKFGIIFQSIVRLRFIIANSRKINELEGWCCVVTDNANGWRRINEGCGFFLLLLLLITPYFWEPNNKTSDGFLVYRLLCESYNDPSAVFIQSDSQVQFPGERTATSSYLIFCPHVNLVFVYLSVSNEKSAFCITG